MAVTLAALLFASSAPSPLYVIYQAEWDFSALTLTGVFAVYAVALLSALLVAGSLSDHLGRRPVLLAALVVEIVAMLVFAVAPSVVWLFAARILQGLATGVAMGCISAALLDLQPPERDWQGALTGVVAPLSGLAAGAIFAGVLADRSADPVGLVFWLLLAVFVAMAALALVLPETVQRGDGWRDSLRPRIGVPPHVRSAFAAALPSMIATWSLGGLVLSLGPSISQELVGADTHLEAALPIFALAGISAITSFAVRHADPRTAARAGLSALIAGVAVVLLAVVTSSGRAVPGRRGHQRPGLRAVVRGGLPRADRHGRSRPPGRAGLVGADRRLPGLQRARAGRRPGRDPGRPGGHRRGLRRDPDRGRLRGAGADRPAGRRVGTPGRGY